MPGQTGVFVPFLYYLDQNPPLGEELYWAIYAIGFAIACTGIVLHWPKTIPKKVFWIGFFIVIVCGLYGAKLFAVFFETPRYYWKHPLEILVFWQGNTAFYGGFIFGFIAGIIYLRVLRIPVLPIYDMSITWTILGVAFGCFGCLFAGCCNGLPTDLPWGVARQFPENGAVFQFYHPTPIYQAVARFLVFLYLWVLSRRQNLYAGQLVINGIAAFAAVRIFTELFRGDLDRGFLIRGYLSYAQAISIALLIFAIISAFTANSHRKLSPV